MKELTTIQTRLRAPKSRRNKFGGYNYRSCEDILNAVKPLLAETGCNLTVADDIVPVGTRIYVKATATLVNEAGETASVTAYAREEEAKKGMDAAQITGAASSYARKYALNGLFCIDDSQDPDCYTPAQNAPAQAAPAPAPDPSHAIAQVKAAGDETTLNSIVLASKPLWGDTAFQEAVKHRREELKTAEKQPANA